MYLSSLSLKGFKSFPDRTRLQFSPGVSVVVGPNGSGKSNITDALLWALGEQSPLAVRGQSMQDVIFSGGRGQSARNAAEVEVVIDNSSGLAQSEFSEISITRRLGRDGEGEYRMNGARCRLVDVIEVLSDTGLGKEMHSVISQGRVEQIVLSKPGDRRLIIEEAAGLGKHRKRRRRAELKLRRTQENLDRALDVEREARSRLRPLKRQAEAADLHARLERQTLEARAHLLGDDLLGLDARLKAAEQAAVSARELREKTSGRLEAVEARRRAAETRFAERDSERGELSEILTSLRSASERLEVRIESADAARTELTEGLVSRRAALSALAEVPQGEGDEDVDHLAQLEARLAEAETALAERVRDELSLLEGEAEAASARRVAAEAAVAEAAAALESADRAVGDAKRDQKQASRDAEQASRDATRRRAALEAVDARIAAALTPEQGGSPTLAAGLRVASGYELAVSVALGERLRAALVETRSDGLTFLASVEGRAARAVTAGPADGGAEALPFPGARPLIDLVDAEARTAGAAQRLLAGIWLVQDLASCPDRFDGVAVTVDGRAYDGRTGELRRLPAEATAPELAARARRDELSSAVERTEAANASAAERLVAAGVALDAARATRDDAEQSVRTARREAGEATEQASRAGWLLEQRRAGNVHDPEAVRAAQLRAELAAERRQVELAGRAVREARERHERLVARIAAEEVLIPRIERLVAAMRSARTSLAERLEELDQRAERDRLAGEAIAAELRACAREEYGIQSELREAAETVTAAEVEAAHSRDSRNAVAAELTSVHQRLEVEPDAHRPALSAEERGEAERRIERLTRRREQLGPVNPLAQQEYEEAIAHVDELESQRSDLEGALAEVGQVIRETDRMIRDQFDQTFETTAKNFEEMIAHLFPGGQGRLRLVEPRGPERVIGGEQPEEPADAGSDAPWAEGAETEGSAEESTAVDAEERPDPGDPGVEIEVRPAGKAMRRLSLLSGGEKSLVAIAFLFAVFLARPCPFYVLDEIEAALDDANIDRFLQLVRRYSEQTQFIIVTHQKRTMDAADVLYGVTMGDDGVTKVLSRRLPQNEQAELGSAPAAAEAA